jgi:hypothetical protein
MKYPFQPEILDALPEELAELYRGLEDTLLMEICSRLKLRDELNEVTVQGIMKWMNEDEATAKAALPKMQDMTTEQQREVE